MGITGHNILYFFPQNIILQSLAILGDWLSYSGVHTDYQNAGLLEPNPQTPTFFIIFFLKFFYLRYLKKEVWGLMSWNKYSRPMAELIKQYSVKE